MKLHEIIAELEALNTHNSQKMSGIRTMANLALKQAKNANKPDKLLVELLEGLNIAIEEYNEVS